MAQNRLGDLHQPALARLGLVVVSRITILLMSLAKEISANGFVFLKEFEPTQESLEAFQLLGIVEYLEGLNAIQALKPRSNSEAEPNTYSRIFGKSEFPMHTDLAHWAVPPRYLALRCVHGSSTIRTNLLDGTAVSSEFGLEILQSTLVRPRRPMRNSRQLFRLVEPTDDAPHIRFRWDSQFLEPASSLAEEIFLALVSFIALIKPEHVVLRDPGDTLIIDNWLWLHGRTSADSISNLRHVDRGYLSFLV